MDERDVPSDRPADETAIPADDEPEPDWAAEIRRLRAERGKHLADELDEPEEER